MMFSAKSPTRVDLAGGTLDLWPLFGFLGESFTINVAIDICTYADLRVREDSKVQLHIADLQAEQIYPNIEACLADPDPRFSLLRSHLRFWMPQKGFELKTRSESPIGGGLGGSSSLCISLIAVFSNWLGRKLNLHETVNLAHNIEAHVLRMPTGTQDYVPAVVGGLCSIRYGWDQMEVVKSELSGEEFAGRFLLVYTGKPHHSGFNNWQVLKQSIDGHEPTLRALEDLRQVAAQMKATVQKKAWGELGELFKREFECRVRISPVFSSPEIERLREVSLRAGAQAVKICGAGGGGSVLVWCPEKKRDEVAQACRNAGFHVLNASPTNQGCHVNKS